MRLTKLILISKHSWCLSDVFFLGFVWFLSRQNLCDPIDFFSKKNSISVPSQVIFRKSVPVRELGFAVMTKKIGPEQTLVKRKEMEIGTLGAAAQRLQRRRRLRWAPGGRPAGAQGPDHGRWTSRTTCPRSTRWRRRRRRRRRRR